MLAVKSKTKEGNMDVWEMERVDLPGTKACAFMPLALELAPAHHANCLTPTPARCKKLASESGTYLHQTARHQRRIRNVQLQ